MVAGVARHAVVGAVGAAAGRSCSPNCGTARSVLADAHIWFASLGVNNEMVTIRACILYVKCVLCSIALTHKGR